MDEQESELSDYPGEDMDGGNEEMTGTEQLSPTKSSPERDSDLRQTLDQE